MMDEPVSLPTRIGLTAVQTQNLSEPELLHYLLRTGVTRLTAERIMERERDDAEPGRARRRTYSRG